MKKRINYWQKLEEEGIYHVYNRSIGGEDLYITDENFRFFLQRWDKYLGTYLEVLAYCLMPNHFHFMIKVKIIDEVLMEQVQKEGTIISVNFRNKEVEYNDFLLDQFKRLFSSYSLSFNKQYNRTGSLFQKRFKRIRLNTPSRVVEQLLYIHHNPIHHGFVGDYSLWKYSSYEAYFSKASTKLAKSTFNRIFEHEFDVSLIKAHENYKNKRRNERLDLDDFE